MSENPTALDALLPHRPPMRLIDAVESFDPVAGSLTARVTMTEDQLFFVKGGVPNWVAIEYMAQTAAALAGSADRLSAPNCAARPGLLLGTRRLELLSDRFIAGKTYRITATTAFADSDAAAFECRMETYPETPEEEAQVVATATLNAYRPENFKQFLEERA